MCRGLLPAICQPRVLIAIALVLCWDLRNMSDANQQNNLQLRSPFKPQQRRSSMPLGMTREAVEAVKLPIPEMSDETGMGPFVGNIVEAETETMLSPKDKKLCAGGVPTIATRGMVGSSLKRSYFAATKEELEKKLQGEMREKREAKRSEPVNEPTLPWTCETKYEWHDMGLDHYPRFVRTAECSTRSCFNGFFRCRPRRYKTKVLKRSTPSDSASCEMGDASIPDSLRSQWRFITVTISLCCDCVGRMPGTEVVA